MSHTTKEKVRLKVGKDLENAGLFFSHVEAMLGPKWGMTWFVF